jgi:hypothetical protein
LERGGRRIARQAVASDRSQSRDYDSPVLIVSIEINFGLRGINRAGNLPLAVSYLQACLLHVGAILPRVIDQF